VKEQHLQRLLQHPVLPWERFDRSGRVHAHLGVSVDHLQKAAVILVNQETIGLHLRDGRQHNKVFLWLWVRRECAPNQPIHLYCFTGEKEDVLLYQCQEAIPSCYFDFYGLMMIIIISFALVVFIILIPPPSSAL